MCGITGILDFDTKVIKKDLVKMTDKIKHRGPDGHSYYVDDYIGLGHRRLSIIDLSEAGKQPMYNEDETIAIVFNGEIYNFQELKMQLTKNHEFSSKTDTEVLIHGYEEWGIDGLLKRLDGEFAFVIYDKNKKKVFGVRDQLGVKPLYYYRKDNKFVFASEMKAILALEFVSKDINREALWHYLSFLAEPAPLTLINNIYKLPSGHYFYADLKTKEFTIKKYFDMGAVKLNPSISESDVLSKIEKLVVNSVRKKMVADVPVGVFLSGGVDSSLLVALNSKFSEYPVNTFSVYFENKKQDESKYAEIIAKQFNTKHSFVYLDDEKIYNGIDLIAKWQDTPIADPVDLPLYYVSELAHNKGIKVVHVGEGSDEQFCGYKYYELESKYNLLLNVINKAVFPIKFVDMLKHKSKFLYNVSRFIKERNNVPTRNIHGFFDDEKDFVIDNKYSSIDILSALLPKNFIIKNKNDFFLAMRIIEYKLRLPELLNMRLDKFTMANSVESRVPFMDVEMIKYSLSIPYEYHMKSTPKYLLKKVSEKYIPKEIIYRQKVGFGLPFQIFLQKNEQLLQELLFDNVDKSDFKTLFKGSLKDLWYKNKYSNNLGGWGLFDFALWYKECIIK